MDAEPVGGKESDRVRMSLYSGWIQSNEDRDAHDTSLHAPRMAGRRLKQTRKWRRGASWTSQLPKHVHLRTLTH